MSASTPHSEHGSARRIRSKTRERGIALVIVMVAIAIGLTIASEFSTTTNIDIIAAANYRDQMRAHFLAESAASFGELVIRIQQRLDNVKQLRGQVQITDYADQLVLPFCGSPEEVRDAIGFSSTSIKGLGADIGTCGFNGPLRTEDDKININCVNDNSLWVTPQGASSPTSYIKSAMDALVYFPAYDAIFDDNDAEGWHRDRAMQIASIIDYVDTNSMHLRDRGTSEDYGYETLKDRYYAKNNNIDTVGEIKLARGVDDRFWSLFGEAFTVYGGCKMNLATLSNPQLIAGLLFLTAKNPADPVLQNPQMLFLLATYIAKAREMGEIFSNVDDFIKFVADPVNSVTMLAGTGAGTFAGSAAGAAVAQGLPNGGQKVGLELDKTKLSQIVTTGPRRTYRVEAYGEIDRKQRDKQGKPVFPAIRSTITGVWDTKVVPQNVRRPPVPNGAWVFRREE